MVFLSYHYRYDHSVQPCPKEKFITVCLSGCLPNEPADNSSEGADCGFGDVQHAHHLYCKVIQTKGRNFIPNYPFSGFSSTGRRIIMTMLAMCLISTLNRSAWPAAPLLLGRWSRWTIVTYSTFFYGRGYWQGMFLSKNPYWQGQSLSLISQLKGLVPVNNCLLTGTWPLISY